VHRIAFLLVAKSQVQSSTLLPKIAAITLTLWKKGENFDAEKLKSQAS
jgi:hypothetical protein